MTNDVIDFCVSINGDNADLCSRLFFGSLRRTTDFSRIKLHIVSLGLADSIISDIAGMVKGIDFEIYKLQEPESLSSKNVEETCDWMMTNCGVSKWAIVSHFDILFYLDFVANMRRRLEDDIGMLGQHCPIMLLNREAYRQSCVKFRSVAQFWAVPINDGTDQYKIMFDTDSRRRGGELNIRGFDNGELLELNIRALGWKVFPLEEEFDAHFKHLRGVGTHMKDNKEFWIIRRKIEKHLDEQRYVF